MEFAEFSIHSSAVTSVKVSHDLKHLITGAEDGTLFFNDIREFVEGEDITEMEF